MAKKIIPEGRAAYIMRGRNEGVEHGKIYCENCKEYFADHFPNGLAGYIVDEYPAEFFARDGEESAVCNRCGKSFKEILEELEGGKEE